MWTGVRRRGFHGTDGSTGARRSRRWRWWSEPQARGRLTAQWVAGDSAFGMSPNLRDGLAASGVLYVLDVRPDMTI